MDEWHKGQVATIWLRLGCQATWNDAESLVPNTKAACKTQFRARLVQLANTGRLRSPDHMNSEGHGIFAVKATCGLRAYGWHCSYQGRQAFVISHVRLKKRQAADPADIAYAVAERNAFEDEQRNQQRGIRR